MRDKITDIRDYTSPTPGVTKQDGELSYEVFFGEKPPKAGALVWLDGGDARIAARVQRHTSNHHAIVQLLSRTALRPGAKLLGDEPAARAAFPASAGAVLDLRGGMFVEDSAAGAISCEVKPPGLTEILPTRAALSIGVEAVDLLAPICEGGVNLVIDLSTGEQAFTGLVNRIIERSKAPKIYSMGARAGATHTIQTGELASEFFAGLRAGSNWAATARDEDVVFIATLPALEVDPMLGAISTPSGREVRMDELLDLLSSTLTSTRGSKITTIVRLELSASTEMLSEIIDTMALGGADAQVLIDAEGLFDPERSKSSAEQPAEHARQAATIRAELARARQLSDHLGIFGEESFVDGDFDEPAPAERWRADLTQ